MTSSSQCLVSRIPYSLSKELVLYEWVSFLKFPIRIRIIQSVLPGSWISDLESITLITVLSHISDILNSTSHYSFLLGGELLFDEVDLTLRAENILIVGGGKLTVGTEDAPFQSDATIEMHGQLRAKELPIYGAKCLAVREGELNLHGELVDL